VTSARFSTAGALLKVGAAKVERKRAKRERVVDASIFDIALSE